MFHSHFTLTAITLPTLCFLTLLSPSTPQCLFDQPITTSTFQCPSSNTIFTSSNKLPNTPSTAKQITLGFWVQITSICATQTTTTLLYSRITASPTFYPVVFQYIDSLPPQWNWVFNGSNYPLTPTSNIQLNSWYHLYGSLDISPGGGRFYYESYDPQLGVRTLGSPDPVVPILYNVNWTINPSLQVVVSPASGGYAAPFYGVINELIVAYNYLAANPFARGVVPTLAVEFLLNENIGYVITDDIGGVVGYLGVSSASNLNLTSAPAWSSNNSMGLQFNGSNVVSLGNFPLMPNPNNYNNSIIITFWYKATSWGPARQYFFSRRPNNLQNNTVALYTTAGLLLVDVMDTPWNSSFPLTSSWSLLATAISVHAQTFSCLLYLNGFQQTDLTSTITPLPSPYSECPSDTLLLGDLSNSFNGYLSTFRIFTGVWHFNNPSCLTNCALDTGLVANPTCLLSTVLPSSCPAEKYPDPITKECMLCDSRCATCTSGSISNCPTCNSPFTLVGTSCLCPSPNTFNLTFGICSLCTKFNLNPLYCLACIQGYYPQGTSSILCTPCDPSCLTCTGSLNTNCVTCPVNQTLQSNGTCQCSPGYYPASATSCLPCDPTCPSCNGPLPTNCLSCTNPQSLVVSNHSCACPAGTYLSGQTCPSCDSSCQTCNGPSTTQCTSCAANMALATNNSCACLPGSVCVICDRSCATCSAEGPDNCLTCANPAQILTHGLCACPSGTYSTGQSCLACDASCVTCSGPSARHCLSCGVNKALSLNGTCGCANGYYLPGNRGSLCFECTAPCVTCQSNGNNCLSCNSSRYILDNSCVKECPDGYFASGASCIQYLLIEPVLHALNTTAVFLNFSRNVPYLISNFVSVTNLSINDNYFTNYSYLLVPANITNASFYLIFNFTAPLTPHSHLLVNFTNPNFTDSGQGYSIQPAVVSSSLLSESIITANTSPPTKLVDPSSEQFLHVNYYTTVALKVFAGISMFMQFDQLNAFGTYFALETIDVLKFVDISYPTNLDNLFDYTDSNPSFFDFPNVFQLLLPPTSTQVPGTFAKYWASPSFIDNFGGKLLTIIFLLALGLVIKCVTRKKSIISSRYFGLLNKLKQAIVYNITLCYFFINYIWTALFIMVEFQSANSATSTSVGTAAAAFLTPFLLLPYATARISYRSLFKDVLIDISERSQIQSCAVVFRDLQEAQYSKTLVVTIWLVRLFVTAVCLIALRSNPLGSLFIFMIMSLLNIVYYVGIRPFKLKRDIAKYLITECCTLLTYIIMLGFVNALQQNPDSVQGSQVGWSIILINAIELFIFVLYFIFDMCQWLRILRQRSSHIAPINTITKQSMSFATEMSISKNINTSFGINMRNGEAGGVSFNASMLTTVPFKRGNMPVMQPMNTETDNLTYDQIPTTLETLPSCDSPAQSMRKLDLIDSTRFSLSPVSLENVPSKKAKKDSDEIHLFEWD